MVYTCMSLVTQLERKEGCGREAEIDIQTDRRMD